MNWSNSTREYRSLHSQWTFSSQHFLHWQRTVRLVVGIRDASLSERMQLDSIAKAITIVRQSEEIKRQQTDLRDVSANKTEMDDKHFKRGK